jgi:DNA-directed RNA polymerase sigma subunit (sigma70/sigma32)
VGTHNKQGSAGGDVHEANANDKMQWSEHKRKAENLRKQRKVSLAARHEREMRRIEDAFIRRNRGLAVSVAKPFASGGRSSSYAEDYINAAWAKLWEAFLMWDPAKGTFATFSRMYITGDVLREVHINEDHEKSYGDFTATPKVRATQVRLERQLGRAPTFAEIAEACGETVTLVERSLMPRASSLDTPVGDGEMTRGDLVSETGQGLPGFEIDDDVDEDMVLAHLSGKLDDAELFVMLRRHGLDGAPAQSLTEVGLHLERNRESVRRLESSAKRKLGIAPSSDE